MKLLSALRRCTELIRDWSRSRKRKSSVPATSATCETATVPSGSTVPATSPPAAATAPATSPTSSTSDLAVSPQEHQDPNIKYDNSRVFRTSFVTTDINAVVVKDCNWASVKFVDCHLSNVTFEGFGSDWKDVTFTECRFVNTTFTNVRLEDAQFSGLDFEDVRFKNSLSECFEGRQQQPVLQNISLVDCVFRRTTFIHATLKNTHFYKIDLRDVNFQYLTLDDARWTEEFLEHAFVTPDRGWQERPRIGHDGKELMLSILSDSPFCKTRGGFNERSSSHDAVKEALTARQDLEPLVVTARPQTVSLLDFPHHILDLVASFLFSGNPVSIVDIDIAWNDPRYIGQTCYCKNRLRKTYHGQLLSDVRNQMCTSFLRVSRECYSIGVKHLYSRKFEFTNSLEAALAFMHDHRQVEHEIRSISLRTSPRANSDALRRLFNILVHERADTIRVEMTVSQEFWDTAPWRQKRLQAMGKNRQWEVSCGKVLNWQGWDGRQRERNFLGHFARLPLTVRATLTVIGADKNSPRRSFLAALREEIHARRAARKDLAVAIHGPCCGKKELRECCYWRRSQDSSQASD
ncbi:hypothetical protein HII31_08590 [Pseudocercospora fuligena]|uniref:Pentapeptide repeat-containing protein n=1 Tax=Pseudocercospora fuligena TaxID=685502 RepID=A0A8H6VJG7_9PEZI|nr:hypothetical protein HII31_08590 [Pseudocercospora fuligena]